LDVNAFADKKDVNWFMLYMLGIISVIL